MWKRLEIQIPVTSGERLRTFPLIEPWFGVCRMGIEMSTSQDLGRTNDRWVRCPGPRLAERGLIKSYDYFQSLNTVWFIFLRWVCTFFCFDWEFTSSGPWHCLAHADQMLQSAVIDVWTWNEENKLRWGIRWNESFARWSPEVNNYTSEWW